MKRPLITVNALIAQVREHGRVALPQDALITPAARDWLRGARVTVRQIDAAAAAAPTNSAPPVYLVGDPKVASVQALLPQLERQCPSLRFLPCNGDLRGVLSAVGEMCAGLGACTRRRGIAVVPDGAAVSCVANKHAKVRAAILNQPSALFALVHELGINLLILECERLSLQSIRAAIETFLTSRPAISSELEAALAGPALVPASSNSCCGGKCGGCHKAKAG
jgi:hypothetical protein